MSVIPTNVTPAEAADVFTRVGLLAAEVATALAATPDVPPTLPDGVADIVTLVRPASTYAAIDDTAQLADFADAVAGRARPGLHRILAAGRTTAAHAQDLADSCVAALAARIDAEARRSLVAALHTLKSSGALQAATPEARYAEFATASRHPDFEQALRATFPQLAHRVDALIDGLHTHLAELTTRLDAAAQDSTLQTVTGRRFTQPVVVRLDLSLGDAHAGRSVCAITVADHDAPGEVQLVYKPRDVRVEASFGEFVRRVSTAVAIPLPTLRVACGDGYGWQQYADRSPATDSLRFARATGALLGILHVLRASDMHLDNVLLHRGGPVVVDAETLFSVNQVAGNPVSVDTGIDGVDTVVATGLLPRRMDTGDHSSIDVSFLGYAPGEGTFGRSMTLSDDHTDRVRVSSAPHALTQPAAHPLTSPSAAELDALVDGFEVVYRWSMEHRHTLAGWLDELFDGMWVRTVLTHTHTYSQLVRAVTHPRFTTSPALTLALLHRCAFGRIDRVGPEVIRREIVAMLDGDIPYYRFRTDDVRLFSHDGQPLEAVLAESPLDRARRNVIAMDDSRRTLNVRLIRQSFVDRTPPEADVPRWQPTHGRSSVIRTPRRWSSLVRTVADDLAEAALRRTVPAARERRAMTRVDWFGATLHDTSQDYPWRMEWQADGLYAGVAGIALFLAAAGATLDNATYRDLAVQALVPRARAVNSDPAAMSRPLHGGMAAGPAGIVWVVDVVADLTGDASLARERDLLWPAYAASLERAVADAGGEPGRFDLDVLLGSAGVLAAALGRLYDDRLAWRCGRRSLTRGELSDVEDVAVEASRADSLHRVVDATWRTMRRQLRDADRAGRGGPRALDYSGFAHGTAGLLATLARLQAYGHATGWTSGEHDRLEAAAACVRGRHDRLRLADGTWAMHDDERDAPAKGWCHGTPGVLLGELEILSATGNPSLLGLDGGRRAEDVARSLTPVVEGCRSLNPSLCHGDASSLLILGQAAGTLSDGALLTRVRDDAALYVGTLVPDLLASRAGKSSLNDGLYLGLASIGYSALLIGGLLDGALPHDLPSPLTYRTHRHVTTPPPPSPMSPVRTESSTR